ncbi:DUF1045 domain-containing protein [Agrobacterium tumefaciens]|uniref:DUF1045 domain-containing protein n=1 Tax=Agrobacterium tumefaciens TaxID=358 RepID=UPI0015729E10|nr:DUF1045 domain-containing protein [Agrobacterium tumefaciens]NTE65138.1 DUF1045 domain-containing protein [Agrobacterium tumefaciens]
MNAAGDDRRLAPYYPPRADHPLNLAEVEWRGCGATGICVNIDGTEPEEDGHLIAELCRYGFDATFKAPFRLRPRTKRQKFEDAIHRFTSLQRAFPIGPLRIGMIEDFFALLARKPLPALRGFAVERGRESLESVWQRLIRGEQHPVEGLDVVHIDNSGPPEIASRRFLAVLTAQAGKNT